MTGLVRKITTAMLVAAAGCIVIMVLATIMDILSNNLLRRPIRGTFEVVEVLMAFVVFLGVPEVFRTNGNVVVDVLDHFIEKRAIYVLERIGAVVTVAFLLLLIYAMLAPAWDTVLYPEFKQETAIPTYLLWVPILVGTAASLAAAVSYLFQPRRDASLGGQYE